MWNYKIARAKFGTKFLDSIKNLKSHDCKRNLSPMMLKSNQMSNVILLKLFLNFTRHHLITHKNFISQDLKCAGIHANVLLDLRYHPSWSLLRENLRFFLVVSFFFLSCCSVHNSTNISRYGPCAGLFTQRACFNSFFFQCALDQLFAFCANKVLETKVAGKMASDMCRAAARVSIRKYQQLG